MQQVFNRYAMSSQACFQSSDEMRYKQSCCSPFGSAVENSSDDCQMELIELQAGMDTKMVILKIVWWTYTNSMFVESIPISPVM